MFDFSNPGWWKVWIEVLTTIAVCLSFVYTWWSNNKKAHTVQIEALKESIAEAIAAAINPIINKQEQLAEQVYVNKDNLIEISKEIENMPTHNDVNDIKTLLMQQSANFGEMRGEMRGIKSLTDQINRHLMEK